MARELGAVRDADAEAGTTARLVEALDTIRAGSGETITPADLLEALRARSGWDWVKSTRRLAGLLNPLGIARRQLWNGGRRRWCYVLDAEQLADLRARYGAGGEGPEEADGAPRPSRRPFRMSACGVATACQGLSAVVMDSLPTRLTAASQAGQLRFQGRRLASNDLPDKIEIHVEVVVHDAVAQPNDPTPRDLGMAIDERLRKPSRRFADHAEVADDGVDGLLVVNERVMVEVTGVPTDSP